MVMLYAHGVKCIYKKNVASDNLLIKFFFLGAVKMKLKYPSHILKYYNNSKLYKSQKNRLGEAMQNKKTCLHNIIRSSCPH